MTRLDKFCPHSAFHDAVGNYRAIESKCGDEAVKYNPLHFSVVTLNLFNICASIIMALQFFKVNF